VKESLKHLGEFVTKHKSAVDALENAKEAQKQEVIKRVSEAKAKGVKINKTDLPAPVSGFINAEEFEKDDDTNYHIDWIMTG